tara:strand:+ start:1014 stop:1625 length:612 start_codon:yes stop_codon:yes gene_type:complete
MSIHNVTYSNEFRYVFFRVSKTGTRSILHNLHKHTVITDGFPMIDNPNYRHKLGYSKKYQSIWDTYFKFSIVRNPWDRLVSTYYNKVLGMNKKYKIKFYKKFRHRSFKYFITYLSNINLSKEEHIKYQYKFIPNNVNFIGKFENLQNDFNTICDNIGIPHCELPHWNRTQHEHYTEYYDDETRKIVAEKYAKDIEYFNYEFGK